MKPQRIQLSRKKGFDLQAASLALNGLPAVMVARPTLYGNPFRVGERLSPTEVIETAEMAVDLFRRCMAWSFAARKQGRNAHDPQEALNFVQSIASQSLCPRKQNSSHFRSENAAERGPLPPDERGSHSAAQTVLPDEREPVGG